MLNGWKGLFIAVFLILGLLGATGYADPYGELASIESPGTQPEWADAGATEPVDGVVYEPLQISTADKPAEGDAAAASAHAPAGGPPAPKLGIAVTGAWESKYMWRGFRILNSGVYRHDIDATLWDTGIHLKFQGAAPSHERSKLLLDGRIPPWLEESQFLQYKRTDIDIFAYNISWKKDVCEGLNLEVGGNYFDMYGLDSQKADFLETYGIVTLTKLPLTPHFGAYYDWPYNDKHKGEGWMTDIGIVEHVPVAGCPALGIPKTALLLSADLWYNGGAWSGRVDTGWAYAEFKGMLPIPLPCNLLLIPGITYQLSLEDTVDKDDEVYTTVALQYKW